MKHLTHLLFALLLALWLPGCAANPTPHPGTGDGGGDTGAETGGATGAGGGGGGGDGGDYAGNDTGADIEDPTAGGDDGDTAGQAGDLHDATDAAPAADATGGADADEQDAGPGADAEAEVAPWLSLGVLEASDADGDGVWAAGEVLTLTVAMTNEMDEDYMAYPGVRLEADVDWVAFEPAEFMWYGLFAHQTLIATFTVTPAVDAPAGSEAMFTASVMALNCETSGLGDCPLEESTALGVTLDE